MGLRIPLRDWRHIAVAISKRHTRQRGIAKADFKEDEDGDDAEQYEDPDDLAASHSTKTSENYSVTIDMLKHLTAESLDIFSQVSHRWHQFLSCAGQQPTPAGPRPKSKSKSKQGKQGAVEAIDKKQPALSSKRARVLPLRGMGSAATGDITKADHTVKGGDGDDEAIL